MRQRCGVALPELAPAESSTRDGGRAIRFAPDVFLIQDLGHGRLSEEQLLEEERAYFHTRDHDGDGFLNKEEFLREVSFNGASPCSKVGPFARVAQVRGLSQKCRAGKES